MKTAVLGLFVSASLGAAAMLAAAGPAARRHDVTLGVSGRVNASPSIAVHGQMVVVTWGATMGTTTDVYAAVSRDSGRTFGVPIRVNDVDGDASVGGEQPPHVALVPRPNQEAAIVVVWTARRPGGTRILASRSDDGGASFSSARPLTGGEAAGNRGWEAIATGPDGRVVAVWLDHRELAGATAGQAPMHHEGHDHASGGKAPVDGAVRAQLSKLYLSRLGDPTPGNDDGGRAIASGVCYCCKTAVAAGVDGSVFAAWRHVYPGNIRDIAFTVSRDGGRTFAEPVRVSADRWVLDGCPENGPAMALDSRQHVHILWPTLVSGSPDAEPTLELFYASSNDGRAFSQRRRVPTEGVPRHVQVAATRDDSLVVVWEEQTDGTRRVVAGRVRGGQPFTRQVVGTAGRAVHPVVASDGTTTYVAWTSEVKDRSVIQVARFDD